LEKENEKIPVYFEKLDTQVNKKKKETVVKKRGEYKTATMLLSLPTQNKKNLQK